MVLMETSGLQRLTLARSEELLQMEILPNTPFPPVAAIRMESPQAQTGICGLQRLVLDRSEKPPHREILQIILCLSLPAILPRYLLNLMLTSGLPKPVPP